MTDETSPERAASQPDLADLISDWLDWKGAAEALGTTVSKVRQLIREHQLAAAVPVPGAGQQVPAELIMDGEIVKGVTGLLTTLHDGHYDDREILVWMFTPDDSLPGRPIDALRENRGSEVKRRAQAMSL
ncbi:MAG: Rv2175c family DNA-binding protein [Marmoricola sp.]